MSMAPKPGNILEFMNAINQDFQSRLSIDSLATQLLSRLEAAWSSIQLARIYRLESAAEPELIAATAPGEPLLPVTILEWVLAEKTPAHEGPNWVVALTQNLLLEVQLAADVPEAVHWLQLLAAPIAQQLQALEQSQRYSRLMESLTTERTFADMLHVIQQDLLPDNVAKLSLIQLNHELSGQLDTVNLLATSWQTPFEWHHKVIGRVLQQVIDQQKPLLNGSCDSMESPLREYLMAHDVALVTVWPLVINRHTASLLVVDQLQPDGLNAQQQVAFERVVERLSLLYQARQLLETGQASRDIADNLVLSSRLITTADNYNDMAQAAIYTIAQNMAGVALTIFDQPLDANTQPGGRAVVALGIAEGPVDIGDFNYSTLLPGPDEIKNLWRGLPVVVSGQPSGGFGLTVEYYDRFIHTHEIGWLAAFGLRAGDQVLGTLEVLRSTPYHLSSEEVDAYTTLADQIGVSVRNRQLLDQTAASLNETRLLYDLNQQLLLAQDTLEVLTPLRTLAPNVSRISHSTLVYDSTGGIQDILVNHVITPDQEQVVHSSMRNFQNEAAFQADLEYWARPDQQLVFIEDTTAATTELPQAMVDAAREFGVMSYVIMPIYERGRLNDIIRIAFDQPQTFADHSRRLFHAVRDQMGIVLQSLRLLQEAQTSASGLGKQVVILQSLTELSTVISIARDETQLLTQSAQALVTAMSIDYCQIHMIDPVENVARLVVEYPHQGRVGTVIQPDEMPLAFVPNPDRPGPVVVNDVATSDLVRDEKRTDLLAQKIEALMLLPLFARGRLIGGIWLHSYREGRIFTPEIVEIAQTIMSQVVVGLQNLRLLAESRRRSEQLQRVSDLAQTIQANLDLEVVLRTALTESQAIIPIEQMMIALYDKEQGALRQVAQYVDGEREVTPNSGQEVAISDPLIGEVWDTQQSLHIADTSEREITTPHIAAGSLLVTPLRARGNPVGIVQVGHRQPHIYTEADVIVFQQMIGQLAAAIENAMVYERTQRQAQNEALVNNISSRLQQQVEIEDMIKLVVSDLGDALGARRARIRLGTGEQAGVTADE